MLKNFECSRVLIYPSLFAFFFFLKMLLIMFLYSYNELGIGEVAGWTVVQTLFCGLVIRIIFTCEDQVCKCKVICSGESGCSKFQGCFDPVVIVSVRLGVCCELDVLVSNYRPICDYVRPQDLHYNFYHQKYLRTNQRKIFPKILAKKYSAEKKFIKAMITIFRTIGTKR